MIDVLIEIAPIWFIFFLVVWAFLRGAANHETKKRFMVPQAIRFPWYVRAWKLLNKRNIEWS